MVPESPMMNPTEWLMANAPGYGDLSHEARESIKDFCLLWSWFEHQFLGNNGCAEVIQTKVDILAQNQAIDLEPFRAAFNYFKKRYHDGVRFNELFEGLRFKTKDKRTLVESVLASDTPEVKDVVCALLIIVLRLRNNLLHGEKWAYEIRGQSDNFTHANTILMRVLERRSMLAPLA